LAVLVSSRLRVVGPRHASGTRQLPSKPGRPLNPYFTTQVHIGPSGLSTVLFTVRSRPSPSAWQPVPTHPQFYGRSMILVASFIFFAKRHCITMPISIARATPADLEFLLPLMCLMQEDDPWSEPFHEPTVRANFAELLQNPVYGVVYLVREELTAVGYLVICFDYSLEYRGKGAWIDELFVEASHRGKGIGTQLLDLAETASRELNAKFLHLEVTHGNPALELYRRRGFLDHRRYLMSKALDK